MKPHGYLKDLKFASMAEVKNYVSRNKIVCLLCGREFKSIQQHVNKAHNLSVREYKIRYGIPVTVALVGSGTMNRMRVNGRHNANFLDPEAAHSALKKARAGHEVQSYRYSPAIIKTRRDAVAKMLASKKHMRNLVGKKAKTLCSKCGVVIERTLIGKMTSAKRHLCKTCGYESYKKSKAKWIKANPGRHRDYRKAWLADKAAGTTSNVAAHKASYNKQKEGNNV